jgi:hypothetical protein
MLLDAYQIFVDTIEGFSEGSRMWILSADLASVSDWTAACVVQADLTRPRKYEVPHLDRWRTPYPETVQRLVTLANTPPLDTAVLVLDQTGVGRPVVDMVRSVLPGRVVWGVTITAGSGVTKGEHPRDVRVAKKLLVSTGQVVLSTRRIKVARELELLDLTLNELTAYQMKITPGLNESYENGRDAPNDDLVMALCMGLWAGENTPGTITRPLVYNAEPEPTGPPKSRMEVLSMDLPELFGLDGSKF